LNPTAEYETKEVNIESHLLGLGDKDVNLFSRKSTRRNRVEVSAYGNILPLTSCPKYR